MNLRMENWSWWCVLCVILMAGGSASAQQRIRTMPSTGSNTPSSVTTGSNLSDATSGHSICQEGKNFFVQVEGQKQGKFKGESTARSGWSEGKRFSYQVGSPTDSVSGLPTGKRRHTPLIMAKPIGGASPLFFSALANNENLKTVILEFTQISSDGTEKSAYRIRLTNAHISSIHQFTECGLEMEEISFTFKKIEEASLLANTMAEDDWD
jgi:type VI secretion system Hcp family effector